MHLDRITLLQNNMWTKNSHLSVYSCRLSKWQTGLQSKLELACAAESWAERASDTNLRVFRYTQIFWCWPPHCKITRNLVYWNIRQKRTHEPLREHIYTETCIHLLAVCFWQKESCLLLRESKQKNSNFPKSLMFCKYQFPEQFP